MKKILNYRPVVFVAICLFIGIFIGGLVLGNISLVIIFSFVSLLIGIILFAIFKKPICIALMLAIFLGIVAINIDFNVSDIKNFENEKVLISGRVCEDSKNKLVFDNLYINGEKTKGKIEIDDYYTDLSAYKIGNEVEMVCNISTNEFSIFSFYEMSKYNERIYYNITKLYELRTIGDKLTFDEKVKNNFINVLYEYCHSEEAGIMLGLVFGDKSYLYMEDVTVINGIGMSHILAVSGLHIGFLFAIIIYINKKLKLKPYIALIFLFIVWILYGILTGFPPGVKRAGIMSMVYLIGFLLIRKNDLLTTLSISSILILLTNPREMFTLSFILSISAVLGIISFAPMISSKIQGKRKGKLCRYVAQGVALTISANVFILPILFNVFNQVAIYTVLANLILIPVVTVGYVMTIMVSLLTIITKYFGVLYVFAQLPISLLRLIANGIYSLPFATIEVYSMSFASVSYLVGGFIATPYFMIEKKKKQKIVIFFAILSILLYILGRFL